VIDCYHCGAKLDVTMTECPTCGAEVEMGRLTGILGVVCRSCDAYNEPGTRVCVACGQPLAAARPAQAAGPAGEAAPGPAPSGATPPAAGDPFAALSIPSARDLPPLDLEGFVPSPAPASGSVPSPARGSGGAPPAAAPAPARTAAAPAPPLVPPAAFLAAAAAPGTRPPASTPSFFGELDLDLPVHWTTPPAPLPAAPPAGGGGAPHPPPATPPSTPAPTAALPPGATGGDETQPILLVTTCPSCGGEAGAGNWCAICGQPLGPAHTRILTAPPQAPGQRSPSQIFGPLEAGKASLVLERGEGFDGAVFRLAGDEIGAGRSQGRILFPSDGSLAPLHATFFYRDGRLHVRDEASAGGTFLRLRGLTVPLKPGDLFALGDRLLRYAGLLPSAPSGSPDGTRRLGSPRPQGPAAVVEERLEGGATGRVWVRPGPSVTLGRAGCSVNLGDDPFLSQAHAEILLEPDGAARLRDLGSANGTFVRLPSGSERELQDGDLVRLGREVLRVVTAQG
jgi:pSer/pThr/pTyr-binding forkhead associated (FHA) protein